MYGSPLGQGVELSLVYDNTVELQAEAAWLLDNLSALDRGILRAAMCDGDGRTAVDNNDGERLAYHISGGDDGKVTSTCGKNLVATFMTLDEKYKMLLGPGPVPALTPPTVIDEHTGAVVTKSGSNLAVPVSIAPTSTTISGGLPWWLFPIAAIGAFLAIRRR